MEGITKIENNRQSYCWRCNKKNYTSQSEMYPQDHKCLALLNKITDSKHKFNDISVQSIMSENDYAEIKDKFE